MFLKKRYDHAEIFEKRDIRCVCAVFCVFLLFAVFLDYLHVGSLV